MRIAATRWTPSCAGRPPGLRSDAATRGALWLAVAGVLAADGRAGRRAALRGLLSLGLAAALTSIPAELVAARRRSGPGLLARRRGRCTPTGSLPSAHAAAAAAFTTGVGIESPARAVPVGVLAVAAVSSQVHTGARHPAAVAAGISVGLGAALAVRHWWPTAAAHPAATRTRTWGQSVSLPDGDGLVVVVNPAAGGAQRVEDDIRSLLPRATCATREEDQPLEDVLRAAATRARVLGIAGGDGSVNAAAAVAHELGMPLAVFPAGTLNRFAAELGIETMADAADAVRGGRTALVDVAAIDGQAFLNIASIGSYPELVTARERLQGRIGKWPAVVVGAARVLRTAEPVTVDLDGQRRRVWLLFACNCRYEPSGFAPSARARLDDGLLDVRIVDGGARWARTRLLVGLATGRLARTPVYQEFTATAVTVASEQPLRLSRDGEVFDGSLAFRIVKRADPLHVVVPDLPAGPTREPAGRVRLNATRRA